MSIFIPKSMYYTLALSSNSFRSEASENESTTFTYSLLSPDFFRSRVEKDNSPRSILCQNPEETLSHQIALFNFGSAAERRPSYSSVDATPSPSPSPSPSPLTASLSVEILSPTPSPSGLKSPNSSQRAEESSPASPSLPADSRIASISPSASASPSFSQQRAGFTPSQSSTSNVQEFSGSASACRSVSAASSTAAFEPSRNGSVSPCALPSATPCHVSSIHKTSVRKKIVLLAEDTLTNQKILATAFKSQRIFFILVKDANQILNAFEGRKVQIVNTNLEREDLSTFEIIAILSDEEMPTKDGPLQTGSEAITRLRANGVRVPAYSYTATFIPGAANAEAVRERLIKMGFTGVFSKKAKPNELVAPFLSSVDDNAKKE